MFRSFKNVAAGHGECVLNTVAHSLQWRRVLAHSTRSLLSLPLGLSACALCCRFCLAVCLRARCLLAASSLRCQDSSPHEGVNFSSFRAATGVAQAGSTARPWEPPRRRASARRPPEAPRLRAAASRPDERPRARRPASQTERDRRPAGTERTAAARARSRTSRHAQLPGLHDTLGFRNFTTRSASRTRRVPRTTASTATWFSSRSSTRSTSRTTGYQPYRP